MQVNSINSTPVNHRSQTKPRFNVVIVYEDFLTGTRAMAIYESLVRAFSNHYDFSNSAWKFEILRQVSLKKIAAFDAVEADLILISARADSELPREVKAWIHLWLAQTDQVNGALVLLLADADEIDGRISPAYTYLQKVAHQSKLDFFSQGIDLPRLQIQPRLETERNGERLKKVTSAIGNILNQTQSVSRWEMED
jgi:hypothetical protein